MSQREESSLLDQEERRIDEELAAFTDGLLERRAGVEGGGLPALASAVGVLSRTLSPQPPPDALRRRLKQRVAVEWRRQHPSLARQLLSAFARPVRQRAWVAAAMALVLVVAVAALLLPGSTPEITATAVGEGKVAVFAIATLLAAGALVALWIASRRR